MTKKSQYKQKKKKRTFVEKDEVDKQELSFTDCRGTWKKNQTDWIVDLVTFTKKILNGKLHFLCSVRICIVCLHDDCTIGIYNNCCEIIQIIKKGFINTTMLFLE